MSTSAASDVVFLVPGFLGFEQFREFAYFGDCVSTALRAALSQHAGRPVPVVPVPIPPTGSLAQRQHALGKTLVARAKAIGESRGVEVSHIHLVGHSTGGVDAQLLTMERSITGNDWAHFDQVDVGWLRDRLRSVISIASPHQGSCLAGGPLAQLVAADSPFERLSQTPGALQEAGMALLRALQAWPQLLHDPDLGVLLRSLASSASTVRFMRELARSRALIDDLNPERACNRYLQLGSALPLLRRSFVTVAGVTSSAAQSAASSAQRQPLPNAPKRARLDEPEPAPPDPLFLLLSELAAGRALPAGPEAHLLPGSVERLRAALGDPVYLVADSAKLLPPQFDAAVNDGVVNSARQLIDPADRDELAAIVVADHFDVVGHYDRTMWVTDPKSGEAHEDHQIAGLLHSGSRFRDEQFFELMLRVAAVMAPALS